jgi:hypothetical protein
LDRETLDSDGQEFVYGEDLVIGRADPSIRGPGNLFPTVALSGSTVVWNFWHGQLGNFTSVVGAFDLTTGHVQILTQAHTPYSLADVAVSGDFVAWVRLYTVARALSLPA